MSEDPPTTTPPAAKAAAAADPDLLDLDNDDYNSSEDEDFQLDGDVAGKNRTLYPRLMRKKMMMPSSDRRRGGK